MNKLLYSNKNLVVHYEKDKLSLISFLYIAYTIKSLYPDTKKYSSQQNILRMKNISKSSMTFRMANQHNFSDLDLIELNKGPFEYLMASNIFEIKDAIIELIYEYLEESNVYNDETEKLELEILKDIKNENILVMSSYYKRYLFNEEFKDKNIYFNFYKTSLNFITIVYSELNELKYKYQYSNIGNYDFKVKFDRILYETPYKYPNIYQSFQYDKNLQDVHLQSYEYTISKRLFSNLNDDGKMISIVSTGVLNKYSDIQFKKNLINNHNLSLIVELPKFEDISIPLSLLVLCHNNKEVKVINATKFAQNKRRGINLDADKILRAIDGKIDDVIGIMSHDYLVSNNYDITPHRFFENINTEFINPTKLKDLVTACFRGYQISSLMLDEYASSEKTKIKLLTLTDIENNAVNKKTLQSLKGIDKKMEHYILKKGDLVISCKGKSFKTAVIDVPYNETYISTGSLIVVRCDEEKLDSTYLKIFLDSNIGTEALKRIQTGASVLSLNPTQLLNIQIPLPSFSKQLTISSSYKYKLQNINEVMEIMNNMKEEMNNKFNINFIKQLSH